MKPARWWKNLIYPRPGRQLTPLLYPICLTAWPGRATQRSMLVDQSQPSVIAPRHTQPVVRLTAGRLFLRISIVVGTLFALTTPPFQVADESRHFARAYELSEQTLRMLRLIPGQDGLPASLVEALRQTEHWQNSSAPKATPGQIWELTQADLQPTRRAHYVETAHYTFVSYLPQIAVIMPLRLAGLNPALTLYVARLAALLFWMALTYRAIERIPVAKPLLLFITLLPMTLFQAGSLSADSVTCALSFLLIAEYLRLTYSARPVTVRQVLWVGGLGAALTAAKFVYAPLIGLYALIPHPAFRSRAFQFAGGLFVVGIALLVLLAPFNTLFAEATSLYVNRPAALTTTGPTPYPELNFWLSDPLNLPRTLLATASRWGRSYMDDFVGSLGWYGATLPSYLYVITVVMLWLTAFRAAEPVEVSARQKGLLLLICFVITAAICVGMSMDLRENPQSTLQLRGIQGRYFTPFSLLIGLVMSNWVSPGQRYQRRIDALRLPFIWFLLANAYYYLLERYYF